jgi:hypothetical protein
MLKRFVVGWMLSLVFVVVTMGQAWSGILNPLTSGQKNVSQAGIDWSLTGLPSGPPDAAWTQCGATIQAGSFGNGATDATSAINSAISACGTNQFVLLSAGTFLFNSSGAGSPQLNVTKSNVVLRGSGASSTILNSTGTNSSGGWIVLGKSFFPSASSSVNITSGATAGSTSIVVASASGFATGDLAIITELNDTSYVNGPPNADPEGDAGGCTYCDGIGAWNGTRNRSQIVEVTNVSGTTITISPPLYTAYTLTPQALPYAPTRNSGVENLQIIGNNTHSGQQGMLNFNACAYCWVSGVEFNFPDGDYLQLDWSFRNDVLNSYMTGGFNHGFSNPTDNNAIHAWYKSSANRIYNNIIERGEEAFHYDIGASGNVFAYNYATGNFASPSPSSNTVGTFSHTSHSQFTLIEGNIVAQNSYDVAHGSQSENTSFRNWFVGTSLVCSPNGQPTPRTTVTCSPGTWTNGNSIAIDVQSLTATTNIVGDVVGSAAQQALSGNNPAVIQWSTARVYSGRQYGLSFGYTGSGDTGGNSFDSTTPFTTSFIHGLYNNIDGSTTWSGSVTHTLPASFYLGAKPSWWGSLPWPAIGPDVTGGSLVSGQGAGASPGGHVNTIPAMQCFYTVMGGVEGGAGSPHIFTPDKCYSVASSGILPPTGLTATIQ